MSGGPEPERAAEALLSAARRGGADQAEVYWADVEELQLRVQRQAIESVLRSSGSGVGLRAFAGGRMGYAHSPAGLVARGAGDAAWLVDSALSAARFSRRDPCQALPPPQKAAPVLGLEDPAFARVDFPARLGFALDLERRALAADPAIRVADEVLYAERRLRVSIHNTLGFQGDYTSTLCAASLSVVAERDGDAAKGTAVAWARSLGGLDPEPLVRRAVWRGLALAGARPLPSREAAVVLDAEVAAGFMKMLAESLGAEAVQKGRSCLAGRVGEAVASPLVSVVDDGRTPRGPSSAPFDDEGVPTQRTVLVEGGRLRGFLYHAYAACVDGVESTGNGQRRSYQLLPELRPNNLYLVPGEARPQDILGSTRDGLLVIQVQGMHNANRVTGDFSVGARGVWLRDGEPSGPVGGVAIAGNLFQLLLGVDAVADDLTFLPPLSGLGGSCGSPTLRVAGLVVSGGG